MDAILDRLASLLVGAVVVTACEAVANALDPVGAEAWQDLTDSRIAAFLAGVPPVTP